jgi:hypothetical protein
LRGLRIVRAQLQRQIQMADGLRFAAKLDKHGSYAGVCFGGVGFQFERQLKLPQSFGRTVTPCQGQPEVMMGLRFGRIEPHGLFELLDGLIQMAAPT